MKKISAAIFLALVASTTFAASYDKPGYATKVENGRLWVFAAATAETDLADFEKNGEPEKSFSAIGAGPEGMTVRAANPDLLAAYLAN